ncbi:MAG: glycosyltransferase [Candidatus Woesearchaeota archaeon]
MVKFSVVVPFFEEQGNIIPLHKKIVASMKKLGSFEIIYINDGSKDNTLQELLTIKEENVRVFNLKKNYGQSTAMDLGFRKAKGDFIVTLDGDLQNDPSDIPKLYKKLIDDDLDVVAGYRKKRKDPVWMLFVTRVARFLRGLLVSDGVKDSGCTLRIYKKEAVKDLELWGEMHRYIIALLGWQGAKIGEIAVRHNPRIRGKTKYSWKKSFKGLVDLVYIWFWKKFSARPLHLFGIAGLFVGFLGFLSGLWTIKLKLVNNVSLSDSAWLPLSGFLLLAGLQLFTTGIIFDLLIRTYYNTSKVQNRYNIKEEYVAGKKVNFSHENNHN